MMNIDKLKKMADALANFKPAAEEGNEESSNLDATPEEAVPTVQEPKGPVPLMKPTDKLQRGMTAKQKVDKQLAMQRQKS